MKEILDRHEFREQIFGMLNYLEDLEKKDQN